jgi:hypothetical protein
MLVHRKKPGRRLRGLKHPHEPAGSVSLPRTTVLLGFTSVGLSFNQRPNSLFRVSRRQLDESSAAGGAVSPTYNHHITWRATDK